MDADCGLLGRDEQIPPCSLRSRVGMTRVGGGLVACRNDKGLFVGSCAYSFVSVGEKFGHSDEGACERGRNLLLSFGNVHSLPSDVFHILHLQWLEI
jgi:hypothetical protein